MLMCWGDRKQVKELQAEVDRLRGALYDLLEYCEDEHRMGNFVYAVKYRVKTALKLNPSLEEKSNVHLQ